jgi:acetyl esterase/lipase
MPPFEFFKATGGMPVKRLFVRDLLQGWYHRGVPGHGSTVEEVAESLKALAEREGVTRLVVAGNSAGGYAALLFGTLMRADAVLCFAPQTVLDSDVLAEMEDHRWDEQLHDLIARGVLDERWVDLRRALPLIANGHTRYELYFDQSFALDRMHAERLAEVPGVQMHRLDGGSHAIAREMRESGQLERVLHRALS